MNCIFIYNPKSGKGKIKKKLAYIEKRLKEKYETVDVYETKAAGDLTQKVKSIGGQYGAIVFSGGDGTFNELLQGLSAWEVLPELGYIPTGTTNDIAHSLKIPCKSLRRCLNVLLEGKKTMLDCMCINGTDYAMYCVCAGAFTKATYTTPQQNKKIFGRLAYGIEGLRNNVPFRVFPVQVENEENQMESECVFALIMNSKRVAGFRINAKGSMRDGILEGAIVKQRKNPNIFHRIHALFSLIRLFLFGYKFKEKSIAQLGGARFKVVVPDDVIWNYDGEKGASGPIEIEVLKERVPLIVPKNNKNI